MLKFARLTLGLAVAALLSASLGAQAASVPSQKGFKVLSGTVKAVIDGKTVTYRAGDVVPQQAVVTADSDAKLDGGNGMTISVPAGAGFQAATTADGQVDVRSTAGTVSVSGFGHTVTLPSGSEVNTGGGTIQVIAGTVSYTNLAGGSGTLTAGQQTTVAAYSGGAYTSLSGVGTTNATTILTSPVQNVKTTLSPSTP